MIISILKFFGILILISLGVFILSILLISMYKEIKKMIGK